MWAKWVSRWQQWRSPRVAIDADLWRQQIRRIAFLHALGSGEQARLKSLSEVFLKRMTFHGLLDQQVTDDMAVAIAAQACLPLLHWATDEQPEQALRWYRGVSGILIAPSEVPVQREWQDEAGVMHRGQYLVSGEISEEGPVLLAWPDVLAGMGHPSSHWLARRRSGDLAEAVHAGQNPESPYNVVIHEFCHKLDMGSGDLDGCPPLPPGFKGFSRVADAREAWQQGLHAAFERHVEQVEAASRFGAPLPWLDAYGATDVVEFFPVACEGYFTQRARFAQELPELLDLLDAVLRPEQSPRI